jgi:NitT/TauT family transport system permease protein
VSAALDRPGTEAGPGGVHPTRSTRAALRRAAAPAALVVLALGAWYLITYVVLDPRRRFLMPPPHEVVREGLLDASTRDEMLAATWNTIQIAVVGLLIASVIGFMVAVLMSQSRSAENALYPFAVLLQTVPMLALVPIIGFWFGFNTMSRVLVVVVISLFPIITNTLFGLKSPDAGQNDIFTLRGAGRWVRLWKLQFPRALPSIFTGLRISAGLAVIGAIVGDYFFRQGDPGIGRLIDNFSKNLQSEELFTAVLLSSLFGIVVFFLFGAIGRRLTRHWYDPT